MKLRFSLKNKEASFEADVEKLVEKGMDNKAKYLAGKTRYQIKQEEKRKTFLLKQEEKRKKEKAEQKKLIIGFSIMFGLIVFFAVLGIIASYLNI